MSYSTPPTAIAGQKLTAADWNSKVRDSIIAVANPPHCRVTRSINQSISNSTATPIQFDTEVYDQGGLWSPGNNDDLVASEDGLWVCTFGAGFSANATGTRIVYLTVGGATVAAAHTANPAGTWLWSAVVTAETRLTAGQSFQCVVFQSSGGALNADAGATIFATMRLASR